MDQVDWIQIVQIASPFIIGIALLIFEYWTGFFNLRPKKELNFEILSISDLVWSDTNAGEISKHLDIKFAGRPISSLTDVIIRFTNTGNTPIRASDFESGITIEFRGAEIFGAQITQSKPTDLRPKLEPLYDPEDTIPAATEIAPTLMNAGDSFTIALLVSGFTWEGFSVNARIAGTKIIRRSLFDRRFDWLAWSIILFGILAVIVLLYLNLSRGLISF